MAESQLISVEVLDSDLFDPPYYARVNEMVSVAFLNTCEVSRTFNWNNFFPIILVIYSRRCSTLSMIFVWNDRFPFLFVHIFRVRDAGI